ncbi:MAG: Na+/H+ antiporter NhaA [Alphaproteobacteria bacterium]|nr:Na+/H+ antiporter NhaA [Alphaproteobacteria bacterium]NDC56045.1 Na+/H+ antiporter NhaA [Alphaproteobacteria bacterium]NDG04261.1 Na+/H+ antiporter NhaA [Alphaproteobacteria bacterium]
MLKNILEKFLALEAKSALVLLAAAAAAMVWANSPWAETYDNLLHMAVPLGFKTFSLHHLINDILMAIFFLLVGLEIKRELLEGELNSWKKASLPLFGAVGGMVVPAAIFVAFNMHDAAMLRGWAVPAATDIAFAVGVLMLVARGMPMALKVFLLALAIMDDLGAVIIIAFFYSDAISLPMLGLAAGVVLLLFLLNEMNIRRLRYYMLAAPLLWWAVYESGLHATLAGIMLALVIPLRLDDQHDSPLLRLEHNLHPWVNYIIMPVFALANAGVVMGEISHNHLLGTVLWGAALGLAVGKPVGIVAFSWLACRLGWSELPKALRWPHMVGAGMMAGIGFTMALFIAGLAYAGHPLLLDEAKLGIMLGSAISAMLGAWWLKKLSTKVI